MRGSPIFVRLGQGILFFAWVGLTVAFGTFLSLDVARGQGTSTASVTGTVLDSSGATVPAAQIVITQIDTGFSQSTKSGPDGSFSFPVLPVGNYRLDVTKEGFNSYQQTGIVLTVSQAAQFSISLQVGAVQQRIVVSATPSPVNTTTGELSGLVDQQQLVDLPLNGRNPAGLVLLAAGVSNPAMNSGTTGPGPGIALQFSYPAGIGGSIEQQGALIPAVNGIRSGGVYFSLDGANNVDAYSVSGGPFPNPDAVQEFRVMTNGYGAEYVSAPGGAVNIVTRSGTNAFHGDLFEFVRNGVLNGRNYFAANQDNIVRNQYGGTAGGPILKDKLFIFGSYQGTGLTSSTGGNIQFVPTDAERAGNFSAIPNQLHNPFTGAPYPGNQIPLSDFSPITNKILAHLPHSTDPTGRVEVIQPNSQAEQQGTTKVDYQMGKSSFVGRYFISNYNNPGNVNPQNWLTISGPNLIRWQDAMIGYNYASGSIVNEARITLQRNTVTTHTGLPVSFKDLGSNMTPPLNPEIEFMTMAGFFTINGGSFAGFPRQTITVSDRLSIVRGRQQFSFGGEVSRLRVAETTDHLQSGIAVWAPLPPFPPGPPFDSFTSGNVVSDFMLGKPVVFAQGDGMTAKARGTLWGFYGTDQIRATPRLSLTLGVRWDPYWPFHTLYGRATCFRPGQISGVFTKAPTGLLFPGDFGCDSSGGVNPDLHDFQPRVGFAYSLDQKGTTAIRGGAGVYAMQFPMQSFLPFASQVPYVRTIQQMFPPSLANPWGAFPGGDPFAAGFAVDNKPRPSNVAFPSGILQTSVFNPNFKLASVAQWNLTIEHQFPGHTVVRASYVGTKGTHLSLNRDANAPVFIPGNCGTPPAPCSTTANENARRPFQGLGKVIDDESAGNSSYHALQMTLERRISAGLTLSSNFTWSKSIDTVSSNANGTLFSGFNTVSDPFNIRLNRGLSDFDLPYSFTTSFVWSLPSSKSDSFIPKHVLSHWQATGIWIWQTGEPFSVLSGTDNSLTGEGLDFADRVPGVSPRLDPDRPRAQVIAQYFNKAAFQQNAIGTFGNSGRNTLFGPGYNNVDFAVMKSITFKQDRYRLTFRCEFFNLTNTPHFNAPVGAGGSLSTPGSGQILSARDPRIIQLAMKFNW
jgi:hypothetical protein